jgi:ribonuclease Y
VLQNIEYLVNALITISLGAAIWGWWLANKRRIAAETVGRAEEQALRIVRDAERDAEARKKEALLEAKEKAHELVMLAERQAQKERHDAAALEQALQRRESTLLDRQAALDRLERDLHARDRAL